MSNIVVNNINIPTLSNACRFEIVPLNINFSHNKARNNKILMQPFRTFGCNLFNFARKMTNIYTYITYHIMWDIVFLRAVYPFIHLTMVDICVE